MASEINEEYLNLLFKVLDVAIVVPETLSNIEKKSLQALSDFSERAVSGNDPKLYGACDVSCSIGDAGNEIKRGS